MTADNTTPIGSGQQGSQQQQGTRGNFNYLGIHDYALTTALIVFGALVRTNNVWGFNVDKLAEVQRITPQWLELAGVDAGIMQQIAALPRSVTYSTPYEAVRAFLGIVQPSYDRVVRAA